MRTARWLPGALALVVVLGGCSPSSTPSPSTQPSGGSEAASPSSLSPASSPTSTASPPATPTAQATESPTSGTTYTVRAGDTLSSIARAFGTTAGQLQAWNSGRYPSLATNPNVIEPGWVLIVSRDPNVTPIPTPSPAPATPRPTQPPSGSGCTAGDRVAAGSAQTFRTIPNAGAGVALTFDMGGRLDPAIDILNFLIANEVCATIFATGAMAQTAQGQAALAIVRAHPELFEVGNHTMYHCDLVRGGGGSPTTAPCVGGPFSATRIRQELTDAEAILRSASGQNPQPYWRPPYGSINQGVLDAAAAVGYTKTFLWDIDSIDWKPISDGGPTAQQIAAKVIGNAVNGSNVLFHLGGYETLDALRLIVPGLRDRGFTLTSLSDLLN
jgi:peptidoglycan/xylan/chitin deacetylase (PgdA/CDA1 family)/LysM repeat protein